MSSRTGLLSLMVLSAVFFAACTSGGSSSVRQNAPYYMQQNAPYFVDKRLVTVDTDYLDRYACADGALLICRRSSRISETADCSCP